MTVLMVTLVLFASLLLLLALGLHIAFALGSLSLGFILYQFGPRGIYMIASTAWESWTHETLITVPLFIVMAQFLRYSGVADDVYSFMHKWMGALRGGLAVGTVAICTVFAALTGGSSVGTVTMGLAALPSMIKRGYNKEMVVGSIAAGGTLGILIPPSIPMIMYAYLAEESIGKLFMAGIIPGIFISLLFIGYIFIRCFINPEMGPGYQRTEPFTFTQRILSFKSVILPFLLIVVVLGFIYMGITTPIEAAGIGALGAFFCILIYRQFTFKVMHKALMDSFKITAMVGWIVFGAGLFTHVYFGLGAANLVRDFIVASQLNKWTVLFMSQIILIILGMFMDPFGIMMLCIPIFVPIMRDFGFDIVWFGILFVINLEMSYITPPFGVNLFFMKGVVPKSISMKDIYIAIIPYVLLLLIALGSLIVFPQIALWLPSMSAA